MSWGPMEQGCGLSKELRFNPWVIVSEVIWFKF